jgi:acylphosphatase
MKRIKLVVSGKVQGVFYRNFAKVEAEKLGIKGYAKNKSDGTVEIVAEGTEEALKELTKKCWKGPIMAFVKNVEVKEAERDEKFEGFDIR